MEEQDTDTIIDSNREHGAIRDQIIVQGNGESQSEVDSGTSPQLDSFQTTHSMSNILNTDSTLTFTPESQRQSVITVLPWGAHKERSPFPNVDTDIKPGEYVMRTLFADFTVQAERKMDEVIIEPEKPLTKILQRGEDAQFDQLLIAFGSVAEHCLPSILKALYAWYDRQIGVLDINATDSKKIELKGKNDTIDNKEMEVMGERRDLAVEFIFCLALIEVLKQLPFHPGHEDLVMYIENLCFKHFKYREGAQSCPNAPNIHMVADLYAEVLGVLAQSRFLSVRKRFMAELKELRSKEPSPHVIQSIISLLMGMKFFRIKMVPIEDFEASFQFMQECAQYFLEVKDKDVKHSMAGLFVEILLPMAGIVKNEVNVPCLKNFVESLYSTTLDMCTKSKHRLSLFPLVTCLLCVSQKIFFLQNWHYFLAMCLSNLKNRDPNMSRVALEALYRLLWVYMVRIKCESNSATQSRLQSIVNSLFPKGSKTIVPRDTPLNIFVKIIQFIAQERLDFAMREIVYDLLSVGRPIKLILTPERMSIGLRAFLVVADSLEQKEGEPPMPGTSGVLPSGNTLRVKKTFLNKMLTEDTARNIGIHTYFPNVRRVFVEILRALDTHYGRPLMMTSTQNMNKEPDEMITGERKPRIDLFRTCVAAVPRLIPETMTGAELVDMLSRLTVHMDEELRALAYQSLQTLIIDFPEWRHEVITSFTQFLARDVQDTFPQLVDNGLRMLLQLLTCWKNSITTGLIKNQTEKNKKIDLMDNKQKLKKVDFSQAEAFALVMLCNCRPCPRRLSAHILREVKCLVKILDNNKVELPVIDVIDKACPQLIERCLSMLPSAEKSAAMTASASNSIDLQWIVDRNAPIWTAGIQEDINSAKTASSLSLLGGTGNSDPWGTILFGILSQNVLIKQCPSVTAQAWPLVFSRVQNLFTVIDPTPVSDNRASLLRSSAPPRKPLTERDQYLTLWRYYAMFAMRVVPLAPNPVIRCASPDLSLSSLPDSLATERNDSKSVTPTALYKLVAPLLRCEVADVRDAAIYAMGTINSEAIKDLMEELIAYIKEAVDRKQENMRRRRRRDALRLQLVKVFELIAGYGTFGCSSFVLDRDTYSLHPTIEEYIDGARICLELESEKDSLREIKLYFCRFVMKMIKSFDLESYRTLLKRELRQNLFTLFCNWAEHMASSAMSTNLLSIDFIKDDLQMASLQAACAVLICGPCFNHNLAEPDGYLYAWIDVLLAHPDKRVHQLALETVVLLLDCNPDLGALLDWVVDRCYTAVPSVADACFHALGVIFSTREYPCDHYTAIINVTLMNTGCPRYCVRNTALQLLQVLDKRFFGSGCVELLPPILPSESPITTRGDGREKSDTFDNEKNTEIIDVLLCSTFCQSQFNLSQQLAQIHPELTMPMFSEITCRFQTARPEVRQLLLHYLVPWLHNMELVDPNVPPPNPLSYFQYYPAEGGQINSCRREGWGSVEATEMVLNNLFHITAKFADEHPKDIENVWSTLCLCWPNNLKVIIRYLVIMSGMAPHELLPYAKRVTLYLARSRPDRLLDEMMTELQTVETLNCLIERMETPPFYRLTSMRKTSGMGPACTNNASSGGAGSAVAGGGGGGGGGAGSTGATDTLSTNVNENQTEHPACHVSAGMIHTKRHSGDDPSKFGSCKSDSTVKSISRFPSNRASLKWQRTAGTQSTLQNEMQSSVEDCEMNYDRLSPNYGDFPQPHPLPMPEYGGYFAPLKEYLPTNIPSSSGFHRCNIAVMLLKDLPSDSLDIDWSIHMPLMLHIALLGMDHSRPLVHQHCKELLLNLLLVLANNSDQLTIAQVLLNRDTMRLGLGLPTPPVPVSQHNFIEANESFDSYLQGPMGSNCSQSTSLVVLPSPCGDDDTSTVILGMDQLNPPPPNLTIKEVVKSLIDFIASRGDQPMWHYEDITAKVWSIRSGEQLDVFLQHILRVFHEFLPHALIRERWAQTAIQLGLSCSSRHYAGRSLQIFRALRIPITSRMLSEILSRLIETVAEQGEDMQGYVTELLLTLEAAVDSLETDFRPLDMTRDIFKSTPNLNNKDTNLIATAAESYGAGGGGCRQRSIAQKAPINRRAIPPTCFNQASSSHFRSTSYSVSHYSRKATPYQQQHPVASAAAVAVASMDGGQDDGEFGRTVGGRTTVVNYCNTSVNHHATQHNLKMLGDSATQDDKLTVLGQLFWLAVSLLESDYEHEFLLASRLLSRVLRRLPLDRPDARDKVDKLAVQLRTPSFPGVHALLLKGCTNPVTYEHVVPLLSQSTPLLDLLVVDPSESLAFPMNVVALLPYMLLHYEDANELCIMSAENIAQLCTNKSMKLENLATVMTLYSRRTFSKESFQWTKCVVKYLYDAYSHLSHNMLSFLVEVLERGPYVIQLPVLNIIHCMLHYVDLSSTTSQPFNADLLRVIAKYIEGVNYKEALKVLKLVVTRSSSLVAPPTSTHYIYWDSHATASHYSFADIDVFMKKELPGRTMDFTFDMSQTPLIGRKVTATATSASAADSESINSNNVHLQRRSTSLSPSDSVVPGWKRPWLCQSRVRELLVSLLMTCGQRVGLPKSPSVIFSQSSELLERHSSMASSTEEVSAPDVSIPSDSRKERDDNADHFGTVFKDFDFLEYESESVEGESTDNFNWGVRRLPLGSNNDTSSSVANPTQPHTNSTINSVGSADASQVTVESVDEQTTKSRAKKANNDESSDDELGSVSPLDEMAACDARLAPSVDNGDADAGGHHRDRTDSITRSDTSGSSIGDLGDLTPCNASPNLNALMSFQRDDTEQCWRATVRSLLDQTPSNTLHMFHILHRVVKDVIRKSVWLTREACVTLNEYVEEDPATTGCCPESHANCRQVLTHVNSAIIVLTTHADPPLVWFSPTAFKLDSALRFSMLQIREHVDTLLDRKDQTSECLFTVRTTLKVCKLGERIMEGSSTTSSGGGGGASVSTAYLNEESILDLGKSLYRLHLQLLLLLESAAKMYITLSNSAAENKLQNLSAEVSTVRRALLRAKDESGTHPLAPTPEESLVQILEESDWPNALTYAKQNKNRWPSELISTGTDDEDDITSILSVYCHLLIEKHADGFIVTEEDLVSVTNGLMAELFPMLEALNSIDARIKGLKTSNYPQN